jgi:hypothetical protein
MRRWILNRWVLAGLGLTVLLAGVLAWRFYAWNSRWFLHVASDVADAEVYWHGEPIEFYGGTSTLIGIVPDPLALLQPVEFGRVRIDLVVRRGGHAWAFDIPWVRGLTSLRVVEATDRGIVVVDQDGKVWRGRPKPQR